MIPLIKSSYDTYVSYSSEGSNQKFKHLVKELEAQLSYLPTSEKNVVEERITAIKAASKTHALKTNLCFTGIQLIKAGVGFIAGPVGSAIATYCTHDVTNNLKKDKVEVVLKAQMIAGRRVVTPCRKKQATTSAVHEAVKTAINGTAISMSNVKDIAFTGINWGLSLGKSLVFG